MSSQTSDQARVVPLRPTAPPPAAREPLWRHVVGDVLRRERREQERTLKDVAEAARISMPYLSELERGRKEASSEVLAAAAQALGLGLADLLARGHRELARQARAGGAHAATGGADVAVAPVVRLRSRQWRRGGAEPAEPHPAVRPTPHRHAARLAA